MPTTVGSLALRDNVTGRDLLIDSGAQASEIMQLGFGGTKFRFAAPGGSGWTVADLQGRRLATSFPGLLGKYLAEQVEKHFFGEGADQVQGYVPQQD